MLLEPTLFREYHPEGVLLISCGAFHTAILARAGPSSHKKEVLIFGSNAEGQLGLGSEVESADEPASVTSLGHLLEVLEEVRCGAFHTLVRTSDGRIFSWGLNTHGQCGLGQLPVGDVYSDRVWIPEEVEALRGLTVASIKAGAWHSMALTSNGQIFSWGYGEAIRVRVKDNQLGLMNPDS